MKKATNHICEITELRVLIVPEGNQFFAQGIDIDYATCGDSIDDVQHRFERGLMMTISANLQRFGSIDRMCHKAPAEVEKEWEEGADQYTFSSRSIHTVLEDAGDEDDLKVLARELSGLQAIKYYQLQREVA
jgi:hypothetical protein